MGCVITFVLFYVFCPGLIFALLAQDAFLAYFKRTRGYKEPYLRWSYWVRMPLFWPTYGLQLLAEAKPWLKEIWIFRKIQWVVAFVLALPEILAKTTVTVIVGSLSLMAETLLLCLQLSAMLLGISAALLAAGARVIERAANELEDTLSPGILDVKPIPFNLLRRRGASNRLPPLGQLYDPQAYDNL